MTQKYKKLKNRLNKKERGRTMKRIIMWTIVLMMLVSIGGCLVVDEGRRDGGHHERDRGHDRDRDHDGDRRH